MQVFLSLFHLCHDLPRGGGLVLVGVLEGDDLRLVVILEKLIAGETCSAQFMLSEV